MSWIVYLSEAFYEDKDKYVSNVGSLSFIQKCFNNIVVASIAREGKIPIPSSAIEKDKFEKIEDYNTIIDFVLKSITNPMFLYRYIKRCKKILNKYPDSKIWVRNPSIGCLIFSLLALKEGRSVYNHMCANVMNGWKNNKYNGLARYFAFVFSFFLKLLIIQVVKNKKTINLCTGDELLAFCERHNTNSYQFVDSNIYVPNSDIKNIDTIKQGLNHLFVGRIQSDKGIIDLIKAFVKTSLPLDRLDVVGDGVLLKQLKEEYKKYENIVFHGYVANHNLKSYYQEADVIIVPSKNSYEGFPRVIMESWSYQIPVIVSDAGGVKAFVKNGVNGLLYNPDDLGALESALENIKKQDVYSKVLEGAYAMRKIACSSYWVSQVKLVVKNNE